MHLSFFFPFVLLVYYCLYVSAFGISDYFHRSDWHNGDLTQHTLCQTVDLNNDKLPDIVCSNDDYSDKRSTVNSVYINNGTDWNPQSEWLLPHPLYISDWHNGKLTSIVRGVFVDFDGDKLLDLVYSNSHYGKQIEANIEAIYKNTGKGWEHQLLWKLPSPLFRSDWSDGTLTYHARGQFIDFNNDGYVDLLYSNYDYSKKDDIYSAAFLRTKEGIEFSWVEDSLFNLPEYYSYSDWHDGVISFHDNCQFIDFNRDKFVDVLCSNSDYSDKKNTVNSAYLNTGNSWINASEWILPSHLYCSDWSNGIFTNLQRGVLVDVNADGLTDVVLSNYYYASGTSETINLIFRNNGSGWEDVTNLWSVPIELFSSDHHNGHFSYHKRGHFVDLNGDGFVDLFYSNEDFSDKHTTYMNNFFSNHTIICLHPPCDIHWEQTTVNQFNPYADYSDWHDGIITRHEDCEWLDINKDGYLDAICSNLDYSDKHTTQNHVFINQLASKIQIL